MPWPRSGPPASLRGVAAFGAARRAAPARRRAGCSVRRVAGGCGRRAAPAARRIDLPAAAASAGVAARDRSFGSGRRGDRGARCERSRWRRPRSQAARRHCRTAGVAAGASVDAAAVVIGTATGSGVVAAASSCCAWAAGSAVESVAEAWSEACLSVDFAGAAFELSGFAPARGAASAFASASAAAARCLDVASRSSKSLRAALSAAAASRDRRLSAAVAAASSERRCEAACSLGARVVDVGRRVVVDQRREAVVSGRSVRSCGPRRRRTLEGHVGCWICRHAQHGRPLAMELAQRISKDRATPASKKYIMISNACSNAG